MKQLLALLLIWLALPVMADFRVTVSVTVTNGTTNGQTFVVNGNTRTWTNSVAVATVQVLTNSTANGAKSNLLTQIQTYTFSGPVSSADAGSSNFVMYGALNQVMTVTPSVGWALVSYSTQTVTAAYTVRVPGTAESAGPRTNNYSLLTTAMNDYATNVFYENAALVQNLVGKTNDQTIAGIKQFTNVQGHWRGQVTSTNLNGAINRITNGVWISGGGTNQSFTNTTFWGAANVFQGDVDFSGVVGFNGFASTITAESEYFVLKPETAGSPIILGNNLVNGIHAYQGYFTNSLASSSLTTTNLYSRNGSFFTGTNSIPNGGDIAFGRHAITTLANGANSVSVGTNVFIQVSGPSSAFSINGMDGQPNRDGKLLIVLNLTTQNMTIAHDSGTEPTAANRIYTMTGADHATTGNGCAMFIYSAAASRWILINLQE